MIESDPQLNVDPVYEPIRSKIILPRKRKLNQDQQNIFLKETSVEGIPLNVVENKRNLISSLEDSFFIYNQTEFQFSFPESKFPPVPLGEYNQISYEQKVEVQEEDTFRDRLNNQQLQQIAQKAQFQVKSSNQNVKIPYVWRINGNIFVGARNRINIWENGLASSFSIVQAGIDFIIEQIPKQVKTILYLPAKWLSLIVGRRKMRQIWAPDYRREVHKDFWNEVMENELKDEKDLIGEHFFSLMYIPYKSKYDENLSEEQRKLIKKQVDQYHMDITKVSNYYERLRTVDQNFEKNWLKIRKRVLQKISLEGQNGEKNSIETPNQQDPLRQPVDDNNQEKKVIQTFEQQKFTIYKAYIKEHLPNSDFSLQVIESIIQLITIISVFDRLQQAKDQKLHEIKTKIREKIKKQHTIKSRIFQFMNAKINSEYEPIARKVEEDYNQQLINDYMLSPLLTQNYKQILIKYIQMKKNEENLINQKKSNLKAFYVPSRIFRTTYMLLPPYQIRKVGNNYYQCVKSKLMTVDTSTNFWKFKLYAMRMKSWTINCIVTLIAFAWVGPFGIRCLYGTKKFNYDEYCNYQTGEKLYSQRKPWLGVFLTVLEGIKKSRAHFQSLPDRGLFGKNLSRYFNYFECYVFRLAFVGILGVLIIYPILIVTLSALCLVLILTFWAWVPIIMAICYLFNILVFQFESSYIPRGVIIRSIPILSLVLLLFRCVFMTIASVSVGLMFAPLLSLLYTLFLIIQRGFRTITDYFMLFLFRKLGRTPSHNSVIAQKISGPGMSQSYFYSISEDDVYVLTQCFLEKLYLSKYVQLTRDQINQTRNRYNRIIKYALSPFGYTHPNFNQYNSSNRTIVEKNCQILHDNFSKQLAQHQNRYPRYPSKIRFTQEEYDHYFKNSVKIVQNFVQKQGIKGWVFDLNHLIFEDYEELTRVAWTTIFGCGEQIFQPLEQIDRRFKIEDLNVSNMGKKMKSTASIVKTLEGQITLNKDRVYFSPAKRSLLAHDKPINLLNLLCQLHQNNSRRQVSINYPSGILFPQQNLQQLKKNDEYNKQSHKKSHEKIWEEL